MTSYMGTLLDKWLQKAHNYNKQQTESRKGEIIIQWKQKELRTIREIIS